MENVNREKIAEFLLKLRKENGLTQEQMAKIMYVSEKTIRNWEQGKTLPSMEDLVMIVNTFSVSLESKTITLYSLVSGFYSVILFKNPLIASV